jgi:RNA polymerase sigma-70 factor (ECF subfamily)
MVPGRIYPYGPHPMALDMHTSHLDAAQEQALAERASSDARAFGKLFDEYMPRVYGFIARRVEDRAAAEELTAATFERALDAVRTGQLGEAPFGGFVYRVAASAVVDRVRRSRRPILPNVRASDLDQGNDRQVAEAIGAQSAARAFAAAVDRRILRRSLEAIPEAQLRVILLRYFDSLGANEACATLGCSPEAFATRLNRALRMLGAALEEARDAA